MVKMKQKTAKKRYDGGQLIQELEPRILLSADQPAAGIGDVWSDDADKIAAHVAYESGETSANDATAADTSPTASDSQSELVIIDSATPNAEELIADILMQAADGRKIEVAVLDADRPGLEQINERNTESREDLRHFTPV